MANISSAKVGIAGRPHQNPVLLHPPWITVIRQDERNSASAGWTVWQSDRTEVLGGTKLGYFATA